MSAYFPLAAKDTEQSFASSSSKPSGENPNQGSADSTSRDAGGANTKGPGGGSGSGGAGNSRKRRTAGSVSSIACSQCRSARQKCDGIRPATCSRCAQRKLTCIYEPHTKTHKDDLIREIEGLREKNTGLQNRNQQFAEEAAENEGQNQDLREEGSWHRIILDTIRVNGHDREIVARLRAGESHQAIADWLVQENPDFAKLGHEHGSHLKLVDVVHTFEAQFNEEDSLHQFRADESEIPWTNVSTNRKLIAHLFDLYFTWIHPVHMLFDETEFKKDFGSNQAEHCSISLVNAVCALACNLVESEDLLEGRSSVDNMGTMREGFMNAARKALSRKTYGYMTSVQTFAVMFLVELGSGRARAATGYLRSAVENMRTVEGPQQTKEARELTLLGLQTLNTVWAGVTYQKLYTAQEPKDPNFQHIRLDADHAVWRFYRHPGDKRELPVAPSYAILTACHQAKLFRIANDCISIYCGIRGQINAFKVLELYRRLQDWRDQLPREVADLGREMPLPHTLYLHVQYHTVVVQLFLPLFRGGYFEDDDEIELRRLVVHHARSGFEPLSHLKRLYSTRFLTPLMSFCLVHLCGTLVRFSSQEPPADDTITFCLQALQEARAGFAFCGPLQALFCNEIEGLVPAVPDYAHEISNSLDQYTMDDLLDACLRLEYTQPLQPILRYVDRNIAKEWSKEWELQIIRRGREAIQDQGGEYLRIGRLLNS